MNKKRIGALLVASVLITQQVPLSDATEIAAVYGRDSPSMITSESGDTIEASGKAEGALFTDDGTPSEEAAGAVSPNSVDDESGPDTENKAASETSPSFLDSQISKTKPFPYEDVPESSEYYKPVYYLWDQGILAEGKKFYPDYTLSLEDASKILVCVYCSLHNTEGTYEADSIQSAIDYGLLPDGVPESSEISNETMLIMLYHLGLPLEDQRVVGDIPGLTADNSHYKEIISLYRAGVFNGNGSDGKLYGAAPVTRGVFASSLAALLEPSLRHTEPIGTNKEPSGTGSPPDSAPSGTGTESPDTPAGTASPDGSATSDENPEPVKPKTGLDAFEDIPGMVNPFTDIDPKSNLYGSIMGMYSLGLMNGVTETSFAPKNPITASQFAVIAVRIYEKYHGIASDFTAAPGVIWYEPYMIKASEYGLLPSGLADYAKPLTRKQAFYITYRIFPDTELAARRKVYRLPDLSPADPQYQEIMALYRAGISGGSDVFGTFEGGRSISRMESAALLYRLVRPETRQSNELKLVKGMDAFKPKEGATTFPFKDVDPKAWYANDLKSLYNIGLMNGVTPTAFSPEGMMSLAEAITLTVRVYEYFNGFVWSENSSALAPGEPWYTNYIMLANTYKLIDPEWTDFDAPTCKDQLAYLLCHALPMAKAYIAINDIKLKNIPDVDVNNKYCNQIVNLYNAGIMSGVTEKGDFQPGSNATRAMVASVFARLIYPEKRVHFSLKPDLTGLMNMVSSAISGYPGTWSVYFCDYDSGADFVIHDWRMWSASVVKLYVAATVLQSLENGSLQNSYGVQSDLHDMITWSSNTAWTSLYTRLGNGNSSAGREKVNQFCRANGYTNSGRLSNSAPYNSTSAKDTGLFLYRMLNGVNVSESASKQLLSLMKQQERKSKIPAGVPAGIVTANKTGELYASIPVENDAAIVYAPFGTYILVVLTQHGSVTNIRNLSSLIYNYLNSYLNK